MSSMEYLKKKYPEVVILMSTYNGERFICQQLDSVLNQVEVKVKLIIRDDGSSDSTTSILTEYEEKYKDKICLLPFYEDNKGSANSFMYLLNYALDAFPEAQYFGFADQDDYWPEDKTIRGIEKLKKTKKEALYFSGKKIVNEKLEVTNSDDNPIYRDSFLQYLTISNAYGCTFYFNRKLAELCRNKSSNKKIHHDAWIYRVAGCIGANIFYDNEPHILYRQHEKNVVGRVEYWNTRKAIRRIVGKRNHVLYDTFQDIYIQFSNLLEGEAKTIVPLVINYKKNPVSKFRLMMWKEPRKCGLKPTIIWMLKVLFNGI